MGEHLLLGERYRPEGSEVQQFVGNFAEGAVPSGDRGNDVWLAAGDKFAMGRDAVSIGLRGRTMYITEQGAEPSIDAMLAKAQADLKELQQDELARVQAKIDLQQDAFRRWEIDQMNTDGVMSRAPGGNGLTVETAFPFPIEQFPEDGFFRGLVLGQGGNSVLDEHQPGFTENLGAGVRGMVLSPINTAAGLVDEVGSQYSDMWDSTMPIGFRIHPGFPIP